MYSQITDAYKEYITFYYMNEQEIIDNDFDRKIAEEIATKEAKKLNK